MQQYLRNTPPRPFTYSKSVVCKLWLVALVVLGLMALNQTAFAALLITFDQSAYKNDVWIQVQDPNYLSTTGTNFQATYNNGAQSISFTNPNPPGGKAIMSVPVKLSKIGPGGLNVTMSVSALIYVFYDDPSGNSQTAPPSPFTALQRYQPFELTMTGNIPDQGDLTAIDCFTALLSITSYDAPGTQLQHVGWGTASAAQIGRQFKQVAVFGGKASPVVKNASGKTIRYIGPSKFDPSNPQNKPMPWPSFIPYTKSIYNANKGTHIFNQNSFDPQNRYNYTFGADMMLTANPDGSLTITSKITATSTPTTDPNLPQNGYWDDSGVPGGNPWSISAADSDSFNYAIYAQTRNATAVVIDETKSPYSDFKTFCNSIPGLAGAYNTTLDLIVGEATGAVLFGYANSSVLYNGTPIGDMDSRDWWKMNPVIAFSDLQPSHSNPPFYSAYGDVIYRNSNNGVYGAPYSDRFKQAINSPLINSVSYNSQNVAKWVIGIGAPLPGTKALPGMLLLLM
ncbi:MAG: hypothetical protein AB1424_17345 [Thermodesulfobacteriota bacterium]